MKPVKYEEFKNYPIDTLYVEQMENLVTHNICIFKGIMNSVFYYDLLTSNFDSNSQYINTFKYLDEITFLVLEEQDIKNLKMKMKKYLI